MYDSVYLAMNGVVPDYRAGGVLPDLRRTKLVHIVETIKAKERRELLRAIAGAVGGNE